MQNYNVDLLGIDTGAVAGSVKVTVPQQAATTCNVRTQRFATRGMLPGAACQCPVATGRDESVIHSLHDPAYNFAP